MLKWLARITEERSWKFWLNDDEAAAESTLVRNMKSNNAGFYHFSRRSRAKQQFSDLFIPADDK